MFRAAYGSRSAVPLPKMQALRDDFDCHRLFLSGPNVACKSEPPHSRFPHPRSIVDGPKVSAHALPEGLSNSLVAVRTRLRYRPVQASPARRWTNPSLRRCSSSSAVVVQGKISEFFRSSGGFDGRPSDHPPCPMRGSSGRLCSHARQTSEMVPALPPMTMQASPDKAMSKLRASPMPQGTTTVAGQSGGGMWSGGTILNTRPPAAIARSAATLVAGLPQPLTKVIPSEAKSAPASPAHSNAEEPGSALPRTQT